MKERQDNILSDSIINNADAICFTSNGVVKNNKELIMGGGVALLFKNKFPWLPKEIGMKVFGHGNHVYSSSLPCNESRKYIVSFPTKNHWKDKSDIKLIEQSANELVKLSNNYDFKLVYLPFPGIGLGGLNKHDVRKVIEKILDDRFIVLTY